MSLKLLSAFLCHGLRIIVTDAFLKSRMACRDRCCFIESSPAARATDRSVVAAEVAEVVARAETDQTVVAAVLGSVGFPDEADRVAVESGFAAARAGVGQAADGDCLIVAVSPIPRPAEAGFH